MSIPDFLKKYLNSSSLPGVPTKSERRGDQRPDITTLPFNDIPGSGLFTPEERREEYRRRGKSPSGVIDGVYNDAYRGNDEYNDAYRDWDADA